MHPDTSVFIFKSTTNFTLQSKQNVYFLLLNIIQKNYILHFAYGVTFVIFIGIVIVFF